MADHLKEGQAVRVKVLEADDKGRLRLSMKAAAQDGSSSGSRSGSQRRRSSSLAVGAAKKRGGRCRPFFWLTAQLDSSRLHCG